MKHLNTSMSQIIIPQTGGLQHSILATPPLEYGEPLRKMRFMLKAEFALTAEDHRFKPIK